MLAYRNGKSAGRCSVATWHGKPPPCVQSPRVPAPRTLCRQPVAQPKPGCTSSAWLISARSLRWLQALTASRAATTWCRWPVRACSISSRARTSSGATSSSSTATRTRRRRPKCASRCRRPQPQLALPPCPVCSWPLPTGHRRVPLLRSPFPFYRDSISLFQADCDGGKNEERWKEFYRKRKSARRHRPLLSTSISARPLVDSCKCALSQPSDPRTWQSTTLRI